MEKITTTEYKITKEELVKLIVGDDPFPAKYEIFWERPGSAFPVRLVVTHEQPIALGLPAEPDFLPSITDGMLVVRNPDSASASWSESCKKAGIDPYEPLVVKHRTHTSLIFNGLEGMWPALYFSPVEELGGFAACCESDPLPEPDHVEQIFDNDLLPEAAPDIPPLPTKPPTEPKTLDEAIAANPAPIRVGEPKTMGEAMATAIKAAPVRGEELKTVVRKDGRYSVLWMNFCKAKGVPIASRLLVHSVDGKGQIRLKVDPSHVWGVTDFNFVEGGPQGGVN